MTPLALHIILGTSVVVWSLLCVLLYRSTRGAAWLAGSTVASCLFFLGATVAASILVHGALFLAPLWLGVVVLALLHLTAAQRAAVSPTLHQTNYHWEALAASPLRAGESRDEYI